MITSLTLRNFKSIREQTYHFTPFDLLVGRNNNGKSTVLQALAIWQFCLDEFRRVKRRSKSGKQIVLPNFTALPVPEFNLLWRERTDRRYPKVNGAKKQEFILIEIEVTWLTPPPQSQPQTFGVRLRYNSPQTLYAIPAEGWEAFRALEGQLPDFSPCFPQLVYVPPFSGLEPLEEWRDEGPLRKQVGKAQPGSVLRNLLWRVWQQNPDHWAEIHQKIQEWFGVVLQPPQYEVGVDTQITCEYQQDGKAYDIIAGGSGFHQALTLLAFYYGYQPTTILLDEPDAHLHGNLQRSILDYFRTQTLTPSPLQPQPIHPQQPPDPAQSTGSLESAQSKSSTQSAQSTQFIIATHAEELILGVDVSQIISLLDQAPKRVRSTPEILTAMTEISNLEVTKLEALSTPLLVYVEGETDERLLRAWSIALGQAGICDRVCFRVMQGGSKKKMLEESDRHFKGIRQVIPTAKRLMLVDYDEDEVALNPRADNPVLYEWRRKNIENYLLVPAAWKRAIVAQEPRLAAPADTTALLLQVIDDFFQGENLTLPPGQSWQTVKANIFQVVNGKRLLFEQPDSLFQRLKAQYHAIQPSNLDALDSHAEPQVTKAQNADSQNVNSQNPDSRNPDSQNAAGVTSPLLILTRETIAVHMQPDEIHTDVQGFFQRLQHLLHPS
ncbi:MAG: ATP-dependent nuclease [Prochlorothrix sp.]